MVAMQVVVNGKNIDVTSALRNYVEKKAVKLERFFQDQEEVLVNVTLRVEKEIHVAEVTMDLKGVVVRGEGKTSDMYVSIDSAFERIERRFGKFRSKIQKRIQGPKISQVSIPTDDLAEQEAKEFKIVRTKRFALKPMDAEEAVMQMELLGHNFFVFFNASSDEVNVVYKRKDGNYGLIEPEF